MADLEPVLPREDGGENCRPMQSSWWKRFKVTIEPQMFAAFFNLSFSQGIVTMLILKRTCDITLGYDPEVCKSLGTNNPESAELEEVVQNAAIPLIMWQSLLLNAIPTIEIFFLGPWGDVHGRKPLIACCMAGCTLTYCAYSILSSFPNLNPWLLVLGPLPFCILGGYVNLYASVYCYVSEIHPVDDRASKLGNVDIVVNISSILGVLASPHAFAFAEQYGFGYFVIFGLSAVIAFAAFLHAAFILPESLHSVNAVDQEPPRGFFSHPVNMVKAFFQPREGKGRTVLLLCAACLSILIFVYVGLLQLEFLFVRRQFSWNYSEWTTYNGITTVISICGIYIGNTVLPKRLKVPDSVVAVVACSTYVIRYALVAFAAPTQSYFMYIAVGINFLHGALGPAIRAVLSSTVPLEDIGKIFSFTNSLEALTTIVAPVVFPAVYNHYVAYFPGMAYLVGAALFIINSILLSIVVVIRAREDPPNDVAAPPPPPPPLPPVVDEQQLPLADS